MNIKQVATLMNGVTTEILGEGAVVNEDLSNVVDVGKAIFDNTSYDHFVKTLVDHIGRVMFVDRKYNGNTLSLYRDRGYRTYGCRNFPCRCLRRLSIRSEDKNA